VVRALTSQRVWFAEPLLSSAEPEVRRLIVLARQWAECLAKPVRVWMSEKQDAFVTAIAEEFSGTPHRYCQNHFMRDLAKPMLELDSRAKVTMRRKVRGWRALERRVLEDRRPTAVPEPPPLHETPKTAAPPRANTPEAPAPCAGSLVISGVPNYLIFQANKAYPDRSRWMRWNKCLTFRMP
jgi:hypothetical protein